MLHERNTTITAAEEGTYLHVIQPVRTLGLHARSPFPFLRLDESFESDDWVDIPFCMMNFLNSLRSD